MPFNVNMEKRRKGTLFKCVLRLFHIGLLLFCIGFLCYVYVVSGEIPSVVSAAHICMRLNGGVQLFAFCSFWISSLLRVASGIIPIISLIVLVSRKSE